MKIHLSGELHKKVQDIAKKENVSAEQIVITAVADYLSAWERLQQRAARGDRDKFLAVLDKVPDVEPEDYDQI